MTPRDAQQIIQHLYDLFNARDIDAALSALTDDVVWANGMEGGHVHGKEALREYWTKQWSTIDPHVEPVSIREVSDGLVDVEVNLTVCDLNGQRLLYESIKHAFHVKNGYVTRFDIQSASQLSSIV